MVLTQFRNDVGNDVELSMCSESPPLFRLGNVQEQTIQNKQPQEEGINMTHLEPGVVLKECVNIKLSELLELIVTG